jgi:hypothetical protein
MLGGFFIWQRGRARRQLAHAPEFVAPEFAAQARRAALLRRGRQGRHATLRRRAHQGAERFDRADKDKNGAVALEELFQPRRKAFARLDTNGDGRLSFEEWAVRTSKRFSEADRDRNGALTRAEFATTAPRRRAASRAKPGCRC